MEEENTDKIYNNLTEINFLTKNQFSSIQEINPQAIYAIKSADYVISMGIGTGYWFQVWASGIKEAGGYKPAGETEIDLPFTFETTTYTPVITPVDADVSVRAYNLTPTSFQTISEEAGWYVKGF